MKLLKQLCEIHAPSGEEFAITQFLLNYIEKNKKDWQVKPILHYGDGFQDNLIMVFGENPKTAAETGFERVENSRSLMYIKCYASMLYFIY